MLEKKLLLDHFDKVTGFVALASSKDYEIELCSGEQTVNAKSIEKVFSLDLTRPVTMVAHCELVAEFMRQLRPYLCESETKGHRE